jgi:putative transposase
LIRIKESCNEAAQAGEIVTELRQVEVVTGYGKSFAEVVKTFVVTEKTHFRRRVEHGGLRTERVKRLEEVQLENT